MRFRQMPCYFVQSFISGNLLLKEKVQVGASERIYRFFYVGTRPIYLMLVILEG